MNYRIETKDAFRIVGVSVPLEKEIEKNFAVIPSKWQEVSADGTLEKLIKMMDQEPMGVLGVSRCNGEEPWRYYIAVSTAKQAEGMNMWCLRRHGPFFQEPERTSLFRNSNSVL